MNSIYLQNCLLELIIMKKYFYLIGKDKKGPFTIDET